MVTWGPFMTRSGSASTEKRWGAVRDYDRGRAYCDVGKSVNHQADVIKVEVGTHRLGAVSVRRGPHVIDGHVQVLRETVLSCADEHIVVESELQHMEFLQAISLPERRG